MSTRAIRTTDEATSCDVCGRTLLRGERAEVYLDGDERRSVCELCTTRAVQEGWIREGTVPPYDPGDTVLQRRRSLLSPLLSRLRGRRRSPAPIAPAEAMPPAFDEQPWEEPPPPLPAPAPREPVRAQVRANEPLRPPVRAGEPVRPLVREPRHVHAVPASVEQKMFSALELFNASEHRRTVAGVSRSLGLPTVSVRPSAARASVVGIVVSWELCWYRYEVDLSDDEPNVCVADQGYELDELAPEDRTPNAYADEAGTLVA